MTEPSRVIDQRVACAYCYRTIKSSQLAEHVSRICGKAPGKRSSAPHAIQARLPAKKKKKKKGSSQVPAAKGVPGGSRKLDGVRPDARPGGAPAVLLRDVEDRDFYTRAEFRLISEAYRHVLGPIGPELRAYWDLDRKRPWGCLTTDFERATYEQHEEASRRAIEIGRTVPDLLLRGRALRDVTRQTGVGLSLGACPWTDHGLFQTYALNKHKRRLTIILGHDWYPIVPDQSSQPHPVDVPLRREAGLHGMAAYIKAGAVPAAIMDRSELLLFLNFKPDFRPPNTPVTGTFEPYDRCAEGLRALLLAVTREFTVKLISWGGPTWEAIGKRFMHERQPQGVCVRLRHAANVGRPLELLVGRSAIPYLPLPHPCYESNFDKHHAHEGFLRMGLGGRVRGPA